MASDMLMYRSQSMQDKVLNKQCLFTGGYQDVLQSALTSLRLASQRESW